MVVNKNLFYKILFYLMLFSGFFFSRPAFAVTLLSNITNSNDGGTNIFRSNVWYAYKFTAGASATISSVTLDLDHTAGNYTGFSTYTSGVIRFYNDSSGVVGSQITGTLTYTSTTTGTGVTVYGTASGGTITIPSSGTYWIGLGCASCANIDYQEASSSSYTGSSGWATILSSAGMSNSSNAGSSWGTPFSTITYGLPMMTIAGALADSTAPTITNVSSDKTNGSYTVGEVIDIDVTFSEAVTSTGNVTVTLETGATDRTCTFTVSSATTGTCNYTVQAGDTTSDLTISTISGTIADGASNAMTDFVPVTNLAVNKALVIDTTAPVVTEVTPVSTPNTDTTPDYTFSTTEAGTISYGGSCSSGTTSASSGSNTITFIALTDGTYSNCTITVTDTATNSSGAFSVTAFTIDTTAPIISAVTNSVSLNGATLSWTTNEVATTYLSYGTTNSYGITTTETDTSPKVTSHTVSLSNLNCGTTYHFKAQSKDATSNIAESSDTTFTTSSCPGVVFITLPVSIVVTPTPSIQTEALPTNTEIINAKPTALITENLYRGIKNSDVLKLQQFLNNNGYEIAKFGPGSKGNETDYFGNATKLALIKFQKNNNIKPAEGYFGPITRNLLRGNDRYFSYFLVR